MSTTTPPSASQTRQNTPARAIISTLSARSSAPPPPSTQTYEPLARGVLRRRLLYDILLPSILPVWASVTFWTARSQGGIRNLGGTNAILIPVHPATVVVALLTWAVGVLPIVVLRKTYLTATPTPSSSPSQRFKTALSKTTTIRALLTYTIASLSITTLHILMTSSRDSVHLNVFVKSRKHPYYLNGRFLFLFLAQIAFASAFHFRSVLLDRFVVRWTRSTVPNPSRTAQYLRRAASLGLTTLAFTSLVLCAYLIAFGFSRSLLLPILFKIPGIHLILRPFFAHFLRGPWTIAMLPWHLPLVWRTFLLGLSTTAGWEFAETLFDEKVQEPLMVGVHTADPGLTLVSGTTSIDLYFKYLAFEELREFAQDESANGSARRTALFSDQKYNPSLWSTLVRESLVFLGQDYQLLLRRGKPAPPPAPAPAPPKAKLPELPTTPLIRKAIFKTASNSPIRSVLDSFAADGAISQAVESSVETTAAHFPELFKAVESPLVKAKAEVEHVKNEVAPVVNAPMRGVGIVRNAVASYTPRGVISTVRDCRDWWQRERINKVAEVVLPHREIDVQIIEVLSRLVSASLSEDRYGVVQRDIPRILEALLSFLSAIEEYQAELASRIPPPPVQESELSATELVERARLQEEVTRAGDVLSIIADPPPALKEGIVRVVKTFDGKLVAFKFPPNIARKLQGFVDYT
ncbi:hypothetical protein BV25DRAFT_1903556, partial [Artomyces pyxidatus]